MIGGASSMSTVWKLDISVTNHPSEVSRVVSYGGRPMLPTAKALTSRTSKKNLLREVTVDLPLVPVTAMVRSRKKGTM